MDTTRKPGGRISAGFAAELRKAISGGKPAAGQFLPSERELAEKHELARKTVRAALKSLEGEGVIATVPRRGYRVLPAGGDSVQPAAVAYVCELSDASRMTGRYQAQLAEFQRAADRRGWPFLAASLKDRSRAEVLEQLSSAHAAGAVLDTANRELIQMVVASGIPAVLVDAWREDAEIDSVMQDGHQGGLLAVAHLVARGHRRIAWFGSTVNDAHSKDRFGGFAAGMASAELPLGPDSCTAVAGARALDRAREWLARADRPTGIVAPWGEFAAAAAKAASERKLRLGRDLDLVGWSMAEVYDTDYRPLFAGGRVPATVTWSVRAMAEAAMARLAERRFNPAMAALRVRIPMRLVLET